MAQPRVLIAIPVYKHSALVIEALESALNQNTDFPIEILLVVDGCPFSETIEVVRDFQSTYRDKIHYIARKNGGLSAARNTAINYLLQRPFFEAIYFLDADNRLQPTSIQTVFNTLIREKSDWVYPNIDIFGLEWFGDYGGPYSVLANALNNICEAGSLVHRRIFEAGVKFDETMKNGFEDWDFWLSAAKLGFRGVNEEFFGFLYRKRFESMLSDSERERDNLYENLRRKHKYLFHPRTLVRLEHQEAPRYAIFLTDRQEIWLTSDPTESGKIFEYKKFALHLAQSLIVPTRKHVPAFYIWTTQEYLDELNRLGLLRWTFWDMEHRLTQANMYSVQLRKPKTNYTIALDMGESINESIMIAYSHQLFLEIYNDKNLEWINSLISKKPMMNLYHRLLLHYDCQDKIIESESVIGLQLIGIMIMLRSHRFLAANEKKWIWRNPDIINRFELYRNTRTLFKKEPVFPIVNFQKRHIGFILPLADFGGVERVTYNVARDLKQRGYSVHVFIFLKNHLQLSNDFQDVFDSINFINIPNISEWNSRHQYLGTAISNWQEWGNHHQVLAMMGWLDVVVNCHSASANVLMAHLRRFGIITVNYLHLIDHSPLGRAVGHPFLGIGYEHAYDLFLGCSQEISNWLAAQGIPPAKIITVENGPGYTITDESVQKSMNERRQRSENDPLQAIFIGRLDRQKNIPDLLEVIKTTRERKIPIKWRIIGKTILDDNENWNVKLKGILEPPVYTFSELDKIYRGADIFVLLSDFEGLPLTLIEAAKHGVIPIATNVGAVREVITDGKTGFLIPVDDRIEKTCTILERLSSNRDLVRTIADATAEKMKNRNWNYSLEPLVQRLEKIAKSSPI